MSQRICALIHLLDTHGPTRLDRAARLLDTTPGQLRAEVEAFTDVEGSGAVLDPLLAIEPAGGWPDDGPDPQPTDQDMVRFASALGGAAAGISHQDAAVLGPLLAAATQLRAMEPENLVLAAAVDKLQTTMMRSTVGLATYRSHIAADMQRAARARLRLEIVYSNAWRPRVGTRVVDPYQVVSTARGYELDAGPLDERGSPRTFLLPRIRSYRVLDSNFENPPNLAAALARNRQLTEVSGYVGHAGVWAVRHFSERCEFAEFDSSGTVFTAWVLPPLADRLGLMMLLAGPDSYLGDPELDALKLVKAAELADHHGLGIPTRDSRGPGVASRRN